MKNTFKVSNGGMEAAVSNARGLKYAWMRILIPIALVALIAIAFAACDAGTAGPGKAGGTSTSYTVTFSANGGSGTPPAKRHLPPISSVSLLDKNNSVIIVQS